MLTKLCRGSALRMIAEEMLRPLFKISVNRQVENMEDLIVCLDMRAIHSHVFRSITSLSL